MSASYKRAADSTSVWSTFGRSNVDRLIRLSTSATTIFCSNDSRNSLSSRAFSSDVAAPAPRRARGGAARPLFPGSSWRKRDGARPLAHYGASSLPSQRVAFWPVRHLLWSIVSRLLLRSENWHRSRSDRHFERALLQRGKFGFSTSVQGLVSRGNAGPNGMRNCTGDEGRSFEFDNQVLISSHRNCGRQKRRWRTLRKGRNEISTGMMIERGERKRTAAEASKTDR